AVAGGRSSGAPHRGHGLRARAPQARGHAPLLPRRGRGERRGPGSLAPASRAAGHARRGGRGRRTTLRHLPPGAVAHDILRGVTAFDALFVPAELRRAVSGRSWLEAMLEMERALAAAGATVGLVPGPSADAIASARSDGDAYRLDRLVDDGRAVGNPAEPLVRALRARVGEEHE